MVNTSLSEDGTGKIMASITHLVLGAAAGQHLAKRPAFKPMLGMSLISLLPDFDIINHSFGLSDRSSPWSHRGFTHSISFALLIGFFMWLMLKKWSQKHAIKRLSSKPSSKSSSNSSLSQRSPLYWGVTSTLVTLSHPLLDALTTGGPGVALWWPLSSARLHFSWRLIPVSPFGFNMISFRGLEVVLYELVLCIPLWIYLAVPWLGKKNQSR